MQRRIQPLGSNLSSFVRASKCIGSFHAAVEEVVLNCIDANSRTISIYVDLQSGSFEVYDDGKHTMMFFYMISLKSSCLNRERH